MILRHHVQASHSHALAHVSLHLRMHLHVSPVRPLTVQAICSALRKLVRVNLPEENVHRLWRGVRGRLPDTFWLPDAAGVVVATDLGLMSTSGSKEVPLIARMGMYCTNGLLVRMTPCCKICVYPIVSNCVCVSNCIQLCVCIQLYPIMCMYPIVCIQLPQVH